MATLKLIQRLDKINKAGEAPIFLRVTKDRKTNFIGLEVRIKPELWDADKQKVKRGHPNSTRLNAYLLKRISEATDLTLESETQRKSLNTKDIKLVLTGSVPTVSFFDFAEAYALKFEQKGKIGSFRRYKSTIFKIKEYVKHKSLAIQDITVDFLRNYEKYLLETLKNGQNTMHANMRVIRRIINLAINDDILPLDKNPFIKYKFENTKTEKAFLTEDEILSFENLDLKLSSMKDVHRDIFVFATYAGGLRISDICLLKWKHYDGVRILMTTKKTESTVSIKLPQKAMGIIEKYKKIDAKPEDFMFPLLDNEANYEDARTLHNHISSATAYANKDLKVLAKSAGIDKSFSFHSSRHTWATRALRKGMRIEYVSRLMGHSSIKTTQIYAKIVNEELDNAMGIFDN